MAKPKLVLWDFDGPIAESLSDYHDYYNLLCEKFKVEPQWQDIEEFRNWITGDWKQHIKQLGLADKEKETDVFYKQCRAEHPVQIQKGIAEVLQMQRNYKQAVLSAAYHKGVTACLKRNDLFKSFDKIMCGDNMYEPKPSHQALQEARKHFDVSPEETLYIADTISDVELAKRDNTKILAVTFGWHTRKKLKKSNPDFLVDSPKELKGLLMKLSYTPQLYYL